MNAIDQENMGDTSKWKKVKEQILNILENMEQREKRIKTSQDANYKTDTYDKSVNRERKNTTLICVLRRRSWISSTTQLFYSHTCFNTLIQEVNIQLHIFSTWFSTNKLSLNIKFHYLHTKWEEIQYQRSGNKHGR